MILTVSYQKISPLPILIIGMVLMNLLDSCQGTVNSSKFAVAKDADLTLLISITSGPRACHLRNAARETWLKPCMASPVCDYRFFVDCNKTIELEEEQQMHQDMVFRGESDAWCPYFNQRHPFYTLNYGNVFAKPWMYGGGNTPYYHLRGLYKLEWKICFTKWAKFFNKMAHYHVYVEDDSFMCTENMLHQTSLLRAMSPEEKGLPFRTGLVMWDGFDDSSTFMSREIAAAFADHYPEGGFNCSNLFGWAEYPSEQDFYPPTKLNLAWGNAWQEKSCGFRTALLEHVNLQVNVPIVSGSLPFLRCAKAPPRPPRQADNETGKATFEPTLAPTPDPPTPPNVTRYRLPCPDFGLIMHHGDASNIVMREPHIKHVCEFTLLIDKMKDASAMHQIWHAVTGKNYHDFSLVFTGDNRDGWAKLVQRLDEKERTCHQAANVTACMQFRRTRRLLCRR